MAVTSHLSEQQQGQKYSVNGVQDALEDMRAAFPSSAVVKSKNLHTFMNTVEGLFRIGDYQVGHPVSMHGMPVR